MDNLRKTFDEREAFVKKGYEERWHKMVDKYRKDDTGDNNKYGKELYDMLREKYPYRCWLVAVYDPRNQLARFKKHNSNFKHVYYWSAEYRAIFVGEVSHAQCKQEKNSKLIECAIIVSNRDQFESKVMNQKCGKVEALLLKRNKGPVSVFTHNKKEDGYYIKHYGFGYENRMIKHAKYTFITV